MNTAELTIPQNQEIEKGVTDVSAVALAMVVTDPETCRKAKEHFRVILDMEKQIKDFFEPHVKKANELHKSLTGARTAELNKLQPGKEYLNRQVVTWEAEEERKRQAEEARLREEARKAEEERRLQEAIQAEAEGNKEEAAAIIEEPIAFTPPPVVPSAAPKVSGTSVKGTWKARTLDLKALCKAVAEGKAPIMCIQANETFLNAQARAGKGSIRYPGVEMYEDKSLGGARR